MCSVEALPMIIDRVRAMGLEPVPLGELERNGGTVHDTPEQVSDIVNGTMLGHE